MEEAERKRGGNGKQMGGNDDEGEGGSGGSEERTPLLSYGRCDNANFTSRGLSTIPEEN